MYNSQTTYPGVDNVNGDAHSFLSILRSADTPAVAQFQHLTGIAPTKEMVRTYNSTLEYRTYMCAHFSKFGDCALNRCVSFHGRIDPGLLIEMPEYKLRYCFDYHDKGYCIYGPRCLNIHFESVTELNRDDQGLRPILGKGDMLREAIERDRKILKLPATSPFQF